MANENELSLSVTVIMFSMIKDALVVMVEEKAIGKEKHWCLPEDTIDAHSDLSLEHTAKRIVRERLGVDTPYLEQVQSIGDQKRIPHCFAVTINYYCLISEEALQSSDTAAQGMKLSQLSESKIAWDHHSIVDACFQRLQSKSLYTSLPIFLLPPEFTLTEIQKTYEMVLGFKMEKKSFRRRLLDASFLRETGNTRRASHRPAQLYCLAHPQPYFFPRIIEGAREHRHG